jgi:hypothetical protein
MYMLVAETWMEMMYALQNTTSSRWTLIPHIAGGGCMDDALKYSSIKLLI